MLAAKTCQITLESASAMPTTRAVSYVLSGHIFIHTLDVTSAARCGWHQSAFVFMQTSLPASRTQTPDKYRWHRSSCSSSGDIGAGNGSGLPGHRMSYFGLVGSGQGSGFQIRCLTRFRVLTCVFIVALFLQSNTATPSRQTTISAVLVSVSVPAGLGYSFQSVPAIFYSPTRRSSL